jgi:indole-3-glycerol phosphate synthase
MWTPPSGTLGTILAETRRRVDSLRGRSAELGRLAGALRPPPVFRDALTRDDVAVIAEIKRRSPSKGAINERIDAGEQARAYEKGGAAAISVLTEPAHFGGSVNDLDTVRSATSIPLLKKDFHVDTVQLLEARAHGASAVLLIARALPPADLARLLRDAERLLLDALVEVRTEDELKSALDAGATLIGVNNRNLETLEMDDAASEKLLPLIPRSAVAVFESGVRSRDDVARASRWGADAVLVGSTLSSAPEPREAVRSLSGVPRTADGPRV